MAAPPRSCRWVLGAAAVCCVAVAAGASSGGSVQERLQAALDEIAGIESKKHNCSVSIALKGAAGEAAAARGTVDFGGHRQANVSDPYVWGSVTKMFTAVSIMKLVSEGAFSLDDEVAPLVDPIIARMAKVDPTQKFSSVEDLWGANISQTTVRQLLSMQAGVPDFDTATPSRSGPSTDSLRAKLYADLDHFYSPAELMSVPWVAHHWTQCKNSFWHHAFCYSSTNFMLLGLILASHAGVDSWQSFDQASYLPQHLRGQIQFALKGAPRDYGAVHGYDRTSYNMPAGQKNYHDDWAVDGVFAGWTASNLIGSASALAELAWEIYGPPSSIAKREYMEQMIPKGSDFYGLGTFNLGFYTGHQKSPLGLGYGHLGATYGYQSVAGYFPALNVSMSVATNIETDTQVQPADTFCLAYNAAAGIIQNRTFNCSFKSGGYWGGTCECTSGETIRKSGETIIV